MSSYFPSPDDIDPATGLPKKKKQQNAVNQAWAPFANQIQSSLSANPQASFGPSSQVDYGFGGLGQFKIPGAPDYRALIENDPAYSQFKLDLGAQGVSDAASRAAQTQRAFTLFGQVPDINTLPGLNADFLNQDITPATRELAQKNTDAGLSIIARQDKAFKDQIRTIKKALASRGLLESGETRHQLQEAQLGRDQARFDTSDALSQLIAGLQQGFAEAQRQRAAQQAQAAGEAQGRVAQQYPAQAVPAGGYALPAPPPASANVNPEVGTRAGVGSMGAFARRAGQEAANAPAGAAPPAFRNNLLEEALKKYAGL